MHPEPLALLIRTAELLGSGQTKETIRRLVRRGDLVRIRRGAYCLGTIWREADAREQHVLRAAAVVADVAQPVLAGRSAAALGEIPSADEHWPKDVVLLAPYQGGGKSEPGVRRTAIGAAGAAVTVHRGLPVTTLARTVVDIAASEGFVAGVVAADWALRAGVPRDDLASAVHRRTSSYGAAVARQVIAFADAAAENGGESYARATILQLGFEAPQLQVVVRDRIGEMRVDFGWLRRDGSWIFGEFDGKRKYTRQEYTDGDPAEVVWREKKREDRLRVVSKGVVRILWSHLMIPAELTRMLIEAGVPRRTSARLDPLRTGSDYAEIQPRGSQ